MKIAVLGTGSVGKTIASKLIEKGHEVIMGSRSAGNEKAASWAKEAGSKASEGSFADAAAQGEIVFLAVKGVNAVDALKSAGAANLKGKIVVDISNALVQDPAKGPHLDESLTVGTSVAEQLQQALPEAKIVKSLNTMWAGLMVDPNQLADGDHNVFMSSDHADAKEALTNILTQFGWKKENIIDLGPLQTARATEAYMPLWLTLFMGGGMNAKFNIKIVK